MGKCFSFIFSTQLIYFEHQFIIHQYLQWFADHLIQFHHGALVKFEQIFDGHVVALGFEAAFTAASCAIIGEFL